MRNKKDMVEKINISNFKSIVKLDADLGRFTVIVGENGCGKSNILEAITYGAAALFDKLDNTSLELRGLRIPDARFMKSAFSETDTPINIAFLYDGDFVSNSISPTDDADKEPTCVSSFMEQKDGKTKISLEASKNNYDRLKTLLEDALSKTDSKETIELINKSDINEVAGGRQELKNFMFYCPEESALRTFASDVQIYPLGRRGEGLFMYLKKLSQTEEGQKTLQEINENMALLDWFGTIDIPKGTTSIDPTVNIRDRYISDTLQYFDQRSTNEGFLFLLFYLTLFISKDTPKFFAIDNLESSFNPKLCTKVTELLISLAKKYDKQVIVTTHSPFILDGLDLSDNEQKLLVVRRNDDGHTKVREIEHKAERTKKLSELWMSGAIGGLPDNF